MEEPVFPDKSHSPKDADLARVLGRTKRHFDNLKAHALEVSPTATHEWKFYSKKSGWIFVLGGKRRNLLYLKPSNKYFTVSFVFGERTVKATEQSDLPDDVVKMVRTSPKQPEGRAVAVEVRSAAQLEIVKKLLAIRMDN